MLNKARRAIPIFEKLRDQVKNSKFQAPSSEETPNSNLKSRRLCGLARICSWGLALEIWNFPELGTRRAPAQNRDPPAPGRRATQGCGQVRIGARLCEPQHVERPPSYGNY